MNKYERMTPEEALADLEADLVDYMSITNPSPELMRERMLCIKAIKSVEEWIAANPIGSRVKPEPIGV